MNKRTCIEDGCDQPVFGKHWCFDHRFWMRIDGSGECWIWTGAHNDVGYGQINIDNRRVYVHRLAYELMVGPIPADRPHLDHLCRNRGCCNPAHLEPVEKAENDRRGYSPMGINYKKTHCIHGHEFTAENTYHRPDHPESRACRACMRIRNNRAYHARQATLRQAA